MSRARPDGWSLERHRWRSGTRRHLAPCSRDTRHWVSCSSSFGRCRPASARVLFIAAIQESGKAAGYCKSRPVEPSTRPVAQVLGQAWEVQPAAGSHSEGND